MVGERNNKWQSGGKGIGWKLEEKIILAFRAFAWRGGDVRNGCGVYDELMNLR